MARAGFIAETASLTRVKALRKALTIQGLLKRLEKKSREKLAVHPKVSGKTFLTGQ
jgi:hypothetical protein